MKCNVLFAWHVHLFNIENKYKAIADVFNQSSSISGSVNHWLIMDLSYSTNWTRKKKKTILFTTNVFDNGIYGTTVFHSTCWFFSLIIIDMQFIVCVMCVYVTLDITYVIIWSPSCLNASTAMQSKKKKRKKIGKSLKTFAWNVTHTHTHTSNGNFEFWPIRIQWNWCEHRATQVSIARTRTHNQIF